MEQSKWATKFDNLSLKDREDISRPSERAPASTGRQQPLKTTGNTSQTTSLKASLDPQYVNTESSNRKSPSREELLQAELESLQRINAVVEGVTASLQKAKANMSTVHETVNNAHTLLDTWTRILSQTEHNQRLILNPAWQGASQDMADTESEALQKQQEQERREAEDARRRRAAEEKKRQEEERRRIEGEKRATSAAGVRRGTTRGTTTSRAGLGHRSAASVSATSTSTTTATSVPRPGRGAISGYGRVGSVGTRPAKTRGAG